MHNNESLIENVVSYIRRQIFETKTLTPGDRINERELSRILNISRAPIREAFRELEEQGFITSIKYKGWFVPNFTDEEAVEINSVRTFLEGYLFETAMLVGCYTEEDLLPAKLLNEELALLEAAEDSEKVYHFLEKEMEFHLSLYSIAKNHCVLTRKLLENLSYQIRLSLSYTDNLHMHNFMKYSVQVHRLMIKYLSEKNRKAFQEIISKRLDKSKNIQNILCT